MTATQCPFAHGFEPLSPSYQADPYAVFRVIREQTPVAYDPAYDLYLVTRYEDIVRILRDNKTFSASNVQAPFRPIAPEAASILNSGFPRIPTFSNCDPPRHPKMRYAASRCLTPSRWGASQPELRGYLEKLIDDVAAKPLADLAPDLVMPLTGMAGFRLLGFPIEDADLIKSWCAKRVVLTFGDSPMADQVEAARTLVEFWDYCRKFVEERQGRPGDDLTSDLLAMSRTNPADLTTEDVVNMVYSLALASHETTAMAMLNGLRRLLPRRRDWDVLCADPSLIPNAVEELLRLEAPIVAHRRMTTVETEIGGIRIPKGAAIMMMFGSANHDPARFSDPEALDLHREDANAHLTFGKEWHLCLGAPLARFEYRLVLERLTTRTPNMRLVEDAPVAYAPVITMRVPDQLLVEPMVVMG